LPAILPARAAERVLRVISPWEFDSPDPIETGYILRRIGIGETLAGVRLDGQCRVAANNEKSTRS